MPNEAEHELIVGVMTSDWLGCGLLGQEKLRMANCGARQQKQVENILDHRAEEARLYSAGHMALTHFVDAHSVKIPLLCYEQVLVAYHRKESKAYLDLDPPSQCL